ncbi:MAG: GmrSD restriction endonuclease domain-containing protein [Sulfuricella sp.]
MKISTILDHIDSGHMALPEFQRGYVWNRDQVRGLFESLYHRHPVGGLLVWVTESDGATFRGDGQLAPGVVKLLLDGQQRMTSLYGVLRGHPPKFFDGNVNAFTGLYFHLEKEEFTFYSPVSMKEEPELWVDVTALMKDGLTGHINRMNQKPELVTKFGDYIGRLNQVLGIRDIELHVEEVTGKDKTIEVVVNIFNRVNSGGTKLSQGDLALAKICADWPEARDEMKLRLQKWREAEYHFNLDWLLRNINTVLTGEAKFKHLHVLKQAEVANGLKRAEKAIDYVLNTIGGRLGLDHEDVLFGKYALPVLTRYVDQRGGKIDNEIERDRLLFWYMQAAVWGRFAGSTESFIDKDLEAIEDVNGGLDRLIEQLRLWHGGLTFQAGHFGGWSLGARFYPMLYLLTRVGDAKDWGTGLSLKANLLGRMSRLEVHHVFPKAQLYKQKPAFKRSEVNAVANFCFLTKDTNLAISDRLPEFYFPEYEAKHPGVLASQWIPMDEKLWKIENFREFLEERKKLLAAAANAFATELYHGQLPDLAMAAKPAAVDMDFVVPGGITCGEEEATLEALSAWVAQQDLPAGTLRYELADESGVPVAVLDLAWPDGLQQGLSSPVAVLIDEDENVEKACNVAGFRYFTDIETFKRHVKREILAEVM